MDFYNITNFPKHPREALFGYSKLTAIIAVIIFILLTAGSFWIGLTGGLEFQRAKIPAPLGYWISAFMFLFGLIAFGNMKARFQPSNWLMRISAEAVVIKFRSYTNYNFPSEDIQVVSIPTNKIAWVRKANITEISERHNNEKNISFYTFIEFKLYKDDDLYSLKSVINTEISRKPFGKGAIKSKSNHYPVRTADTLLRVEFTGVTPSANAAISKLKQFIAVEQEHKETVKAGFKKKKTDEETQANILNLIKKGGEIEAIRQIRQTQNISLKEAKLYIENIKSSLNGQP